MFHILLSGELLLDETSEPFAFETHEAALAFVDRHALARSPDDRRLPPVARRRVYEIVFVPAAK